MHLCQVKLSIDFCRGRSRAALSWGGSLLSDSGEGGRGSWPLPGGRRREGGRVDDRVPKSAPFSGQDVHRVTLVRRVMLRRGAVRQRAVVGLMRHRHLAAETTVFEVPANAASATQACRALAHAQKRQLRQAAQASRDGAFELVGWRPQPTRVHSCGARTAPEAASGCSGWRGSLR
jgi:hypothetical protein